MSFKVFFNILIFILANSVRCQIISTYAGTGTPGFSGDGGPAIGAQFNGALAVAADASGNVYISDYGNQRIRKVNVAGTVSTLAGTGIAGFSGDGGSSTSAQINGPIGIAVDAVGNVYFVDCANNRIRKINTAGMISTIAGTTTAGYSGDGGPASSAKLNSPVGLAIDASNNLYFSDNNTVVRKIDASGMISTIAAGFNFPRGIAVDANGNVYVSDIGNNKVFKINPQGSVSTVAGTGIAGYSGDGGIATSAQLNGQYGIAVDAVGNLYIADRFNQRFRKVNTSGIISTLAGTGVAGFSGDGGAAVNAQVSNPYNIAVSTFGDMFLCDYANSRIRKICASPVLNTSSSATTICAGQTATITLSGASTYSLNGNSINQTAVISPSATTQYTFTGVSMSGCSTTSLVTQSVQICTGIDVGIENGKQPLIYPNPSNSDFFIETDLDGEITVLDNLGKMLFRQETKIGINIISMTNYAKGMYFLKILNYTNGATVKIVRD